MINGGKNISNIEMLKEMTGSIAATDNLDSITNLALELGLSCTSAQHGSILIADDKGELAIKAARGISPEIIPSIRVKNGARICGKVAEDKTPLLIRDINRDVRIRKSGSSKYKTGSFICCPILMQEELLGIINITDKADGTPFTEEELKLVEILAHQTAISMRYSRLSADLLSMSLELDTRNSEINKLSNLLDCIPDFSLLEKAGPILKKVLNFRDILRELTASTTVKGILAKKNISINVSCPGSLPDTAGDRIRLVRAFIHLIDGIGKYTAPGDSVDLTADARYSSIRITLSVKGRRIPETDLPRLFDPQATWARTNEIKNKLKFYLARETVELHKGVVSILNTPEGIAIQLLFPHCVKDHRNARLNELTALFLAFTAGAMDLNKCSLMLKDELSGELVIINAIGLDEDIIRKTRTAPGDNIAGWVSAENKPLLIEDIECHPRFSRKSSSQYTTKSLLCLPIFVDNRVIGVLNLNNKASGLPFDRKDLYFASSLIRRMAHILEKAQRQDMSDSEFKTTVRNLETLLYAKQRCRKKNGVLSSIIMSLMHQMQRGEDEIKQALYSAAFYDLGLTRIDERILGKSGELSAVEEKIIKTHPFPSVGFINYMETDDTVGKTILHHHERYDGLGYPDGLAGDDIPFLSRVLSVADAYTAMTADRPYRKAFSPEEAKVRIGAGAGKQFDPDVVDAFMKIV